MTPIRLRVRDLRDARGWTQTQLADKVGSAVSTISDIERGVTSRIDFKLLERLAKVFAVEPGEMLERVAKRR